MASALKNDPGAIAPGRYAYMYGASQTGRLIRHIIYEGFTIDEQGRKAFDGAFVQTGATGIGSFNERFAQPNELGSFTQTKFPILYKTTTDPITGRQDGLGARIPAGLEPKIMLVDSASEYWDRGRLSALRHTSLDGREDVEDAPNVRVFMLAGTRHGAGSFPPADSGGQFKENTNDYRWAQRRAQHAHRDGGRVHPVSGDARGTREDARPEAVDHRAVRNTRRLREEDSGIRSASCAGALHPEGRRTDDRARGRAALGLLDDTDHANQPGSEIATSAQL